MKPHRGARYFELALIFLLFFTLGGAPAPHVNETQYLAKAKHYWDASYCPGDSFLDTADAHLVFYWTVGWLTRIFSLETTAWVGRIAAWLLLAFGWQRLAWQIAPSRWAAPLAAALFPALIYWGNFAGEWVIGGIEGKCFAYGFFLLGMTAMVQSRWTATWIWLGVASAFHPLVGGWAVLGSLFVLLTVERAARPSFREASIGLCLGGLLALPGLVPTLLLNSGTPTAEQHEAARIYVFERLPHHLAMLELDPKELSWKAMRFSWLLAAMLGVWLAVNRGKDETKGDIVNGKEGVTQREGLRCLVVFAAFSVGMSLVGAGLELLLRNQPDQGASLLRYYWFRQADVAVPLATAMGVALLAGQLSRRIADESPARSSPSWLSSCVVLAAMFTAGWHLVGSVGDRWKNPKPPGARQMATLEDWQDACDWIREETPPDAIFLVDRQAQSFKWYAARGDVANWKDIPQDAVGIIDWYARCRNVYNPGGSERAVGTLANQARHRIPTLARDHRATHAITRNSPNLRLPVVYENATYAVYKLDR
ncbi:DUF6798 domain-containing protein [Adhaeretor mobilis]|uniref:DUF6798 domain-containing protein n=1 Tax=Adhaeretor mobilis TaxID=1930276 RepID=UPI0011A18F4F|nr:DUF6798 domain-containing protein [Adhaeretor mobilis]